MAAPNTQLTTNSNPENGGPSWGTTLKVGGFAIAALALFELYGSARHHEAVLDMPVESGVKAVMTWRSTGHRAERIAESLTLNFTHPGSYEIEISKVTMSGHGLGANGFATNTVYVNNFEVGSASADSRATIPMNDYYLFSGAGILDIKFAESHGKGQSQNRIGL